MAKRATESVEGLLREDSLGQLNQKLMSVLKLWGAKLEPYQHVLEAYYRAGKDVRLREKIRVAEGFETKAKLLGISTDDLKAYSALGEQQGEAIETAIGIELLKQEWAQLLTSAPLNELTLDSFPKQIVKPLLVLYTTDWCMPCQLLKPTFARLSRYFQKATLCYSFDSALMDREKVDFVPQFVACFPNEGRVYSACGRTTQEVWDTMHKLFTLGGGSTGKGRLECSGEECRIKPF